MIDPAAIAFVCAECVPILAVNGRSVRHQQRPELFDSIGEPRSWMISQ
jgi:hypothetical protein